MKVAKITFKDLGEEQPAVPGNFVLQVYPQQEPNKQEISLAGLLVWSAKILKTYEPQSVLPGFVQKYAREDTKPPVLVFQIRDYSHEAIINRILHASLPQEQIKGLEADAKEQLALKRALGVQETASALMAKLLSRLVVSDAITREFAINTLRQELQLGPLASQGLIDRGVEYMKSRDKQP